MRKTSVCLLLSILFILYISAVLSKDGYLQRQLRTSAVPSDNRSITVPPEFAEPLQVSSSNMGSAPAIVNNALARIEAKAPGDIQLPKGASESWWGEAQKNIRKAEYRIRKTKAVPAGTDAAFQAPNRAQNLRTYFTEEGLRVTPRSRPAKKWSMGLQVVGFTGNDKPQLRIDGNRAEYSYGNITEWYVNDERGIEQGFRIEKPVGEMQKDGEIRITMEITGGLTPEMSVDGKAIVFIGPDGKKAVRYDRLYAFDAEGRELESYMELSEEQRLISLVVDASDAAYPVLIDPIISAAYDAILEWDQAHAGFGYSVSGAGDVDGDGYADVIVGAPAFDTDPDDTDETDTNDGAVFIFYGSPTGIDTAYADMLESDQEFGYFGWSVSGAGDVNGDGFADVIIGAPYYDNDPLFNTNEGAAFIFYGSADGFLPHYDVLASDQAYAFFGASVSGAGDVNGDGYADVIIGAPYYGNDLFSNEGAAFIYYGSSAGLLPDYDVLVSDQQAALFGTSVSGAGDVNGDFIDDVIIGAPYYDNPEANEGAAFIYYGRLTGISPTYAVMLESNHWEALFGLSVSGAGDVNGDGYADVIVGAPDYDNDPFYDTNEGAAYIFYGGPEGLPPTILESNWPGSYFGRSVSGAGDVNGDGYADVIIGADLYSNGQWYQGAAFVYHGSESGISPVYTDMLESNQAYAYFGISVSGAGDVNNDGYADVIVGADFYYNGQPEEGAAFIYHGGPIRVTADSYGDGWGRITSDSGGIDYTYPDYDSQISSELNPGANIVLTAEAYIGSSAEWTGCDSTGGTAGAATCTITGISSDRTVSVTFTFSGSPTFTVTANADGTGWGRITSDAGGIDYVYQNGLSGTSAELNPGSVIVLTAEADTGSSAEWTGCDITGGTSEAVTCTITGISSDRIVSAAFTRISLADFEGAPRTGTAPYRVNFSDLSGNDPTSWDWNFGDGGSATEKNPAYTYRAPGIYSVSLTTGSEPENVTKTAYITVTSCGNPPVRTQGTEYFQSLQAAFEAYSVGPLTDTMEIQAIDLNDDFTLNDPDKTVTLKGGYDCDYSVDRIAYTAIGTLTISEGTAIIDEIVIR